MFSASNSKIDDFLAIAGASVIGATIGAGVTFVRDYQGGVALKYTGDFLGRYVAPLTSEKLAGYVAGVTIGTSAIIALAAALTKLIVDEAAGAIAKRWLPKFVETNTIAYNVKNFVVYATGSTAALAAVFYGSTFVGVSTSAALTIGGTYVAAHLLWKTREKVWLVFKSIVSGIRGLIHDARLKNHNAAVTKCAIAYQTALLNRFVQSHAVEDSKKISFVAKQCDEIDQTALSVDAKNKAKATILKDEEIYKKNAKTAEWNVEEAKINLKQANLDLCKFRKDMDHPTLFVVKNEKNERIDYSYKDVQNQINKERKDLNDKKNPTVKKEKV